MLKEKRFAQILTILEEDKFSTVQDLSRRLYVSMPTMRRYLAEMANCGLIVRSHGGAISHHMAADLDPELQHFESGDNVIDAIAKAASRFVHTGSTIFLDSSPTSMVLTGMLRDIDDITVVTNSMPIIGRFLGSGIDIYCCGGKFDESSSSFIGGQATDVLSLFNYDFAFISCSGIVQGDMIARRSVHSAQLLRTVLKRSRCKILMYSSAKESPGAVCNVGELDSVDYIITDTAAVVGNTRARIIRVNTSTK